MRYIITVIFSLLTLSAFASFKDKSPEEGLWEALEYYNVHHKEIVLAQAILETGHFKSGGCTQDNNLFGLMKNGKHRKFNHWTESVELYVRNIQSRYKEGEDYYSFLNRIGYASNPNYNNLLINISKSKFFNSYKITDSGFTFDKNKCLIYKKCF